MASSKSFPATSRKLNKARLDGDVAKSSLMSSSVVLSAGFLYLFYVFSKLDTERYNFMAYLRLIQDFRSNNMLEYAELAFNYCSGLLATYFGFLLFVAVLVEIVQVGFCFSVKSLALNFSKLNPVEGFKKNILKSSENEALMLGLLVEIVKMLVVLISSALVWLLLFKKYSTFLFVPEFGINPSVYFLSTYLVSVLCIFLVFGLADYMHLRFKRLQRLKMDATEFKKEMRESEGDPHLKGMRKQLHQELGMRAAIDAVRKAKVILVGKQSS